MYHYRHGTDGSHWVSVDGAGYVPVTRRPTPSDDARIHELVAGHVGSDGVRTIPLMMTPRLSPLRGTADTLISDTP